MKRFSAPIRFLAGILALWIGARIWWLLPEPVQDGVILAAQAEDQLHPVPPFAEAGPPAGSPISAAPHSAPDLPARRHDGTRSAALLVAATQPADATSNRPISPASVARDSASARIDLPVPMPRTSMDRDAAESRWSGNAYLFVRDGNGDALAAGGQLGGGQVGARIAWRLNSEGPTRLAVAARVYAPLDRGRAAEVAAGLDFHPLPGQPLRLSIERRFDAGGEGRSAWSAYAAGGFWRAIGNAIELDGYAQAGVVGARARDLFADGALRIVHRQDMGSDIVVRMGGGAWAGAQPGVERIDVGPRLAVGMPVGGTSISAALEGRFRIAGDAAPGSGVALTLATDF